MGILDDTTTIDFVYTFDVMKYNVPPPQEEDVSQSIIDDNNNIEFTDDAYFFTKNLTEEMESKMNELEDELNRMWRLGLIIVSVTGGLILCLCLCMMGLLAKGATS